MHRPEYKNEYLLTTVAQSVQANIVPVLLEQHPEH
jgi:hypothetical protein